VAQFVLDHAGQRVDAAPHVLRIARHIDPLHAREVQHRRLRHASAVDNSAPAACGIVMLMSLAGTTLPSSNE
jgi:hypothetical protein